MEDPKNCVASVLSLGRNPETGELEAQLAPCVPGDWDKAFESSQHLLSVMERGGIDAFSWQRSRWRWQPTSAIYGKLSVGWRWNRTMPSKRRNMPRKPGNSTCNG